MEVELMSNSGRDLENFVQMVEETLLPHGFNIDTRQHEYNEEGNQVAELDIIVSGKVGPTKIKYLIECRDRPSAGPAPNSWIEQLVGRRDRFNFNKVIAVSSTGFAPGSYGYANDKGIELRTLSEISSNDILDWFKSTSFSVFFRNVDLKALKINILNADDNQEKELNKLMKVITSKSKIFFHEYSGSTYDALHLCDEAMKNAPIKSEDLKIDLSPIRKTLIANYPNPNYKYFLKTSSGNVLIESIEFIVDISIKREQFPISKITQYGIEPDVDSIAQSVHFNLRFGNSDLDLAFHKIINDDESKLVVSVVDRKKND